MASPISRGRIIIEKVIAIEINLAIITSSAFFATAANKYFADFDIALIDVFWATVSAWLLSIIFASMALLIQSLFRSREVATNATAGVLITAYFANTLSSYTKEFENMKYFSSFYYYDRRNILNQGVDYNYLLLLLSVSFAFYIIAFYSFVRRDIL